MRVAQFVMTDAKDTDYWKCTAISIVVSVAFARGSLLRLPNLPASYRWVEPDGLRYLDRPGAVQTR